MARVRTERNRLDGGCGESGLSSARAHPARCCAAGLRHLSGWAVDATGCFVSGSDRSGPGSNLFRDRRHRPMSSWRTSRRRRRRALSEICSHLSTSRRNGRRKLPTPTRRSRSPSHHQPRFKIEVTATQRADLASTDAGRCCEGDHLPIDRASGVLPAPDQLEHLGRVRDDRVLSFNRRRVGPGRGIGVPPSLTARHAWLIIDEIVAWILCTEAGAIPRA